jgi:cytochrome c peroxidase
MNRILIILGLLAASWTLQNCDRSREPDFLEIRRTLWDRGLQDLDSCLVHLAEVLRAETSDSARQAAFIRVRSNYKAQEFLWEYGFPLSARTLNGHSADEVEQDCDHSVVPAEGLQVLEEAIFHQTSPGPDGRLPTYQPSADQPLAGMVETMRRTVAATKGAAGFEPIGTGLIHRPLAWTDSSVLDAIRQQIFRIAFLGVTGFDSPVARLSLQETRQSLEGMDQFLASGFSDATPISARSMSLGGLRKSLQAAAVAAEGGFDEFDRLRFLREFLNPAYAALGKFQREAGIPIPREPRAFDPASDDLFSASAWKPDFFGQDFSPVVPPIASAQQESSAAITSTRSAQAGNGTSLHPITARAELGRKLFSDPALSGDGRRSCATCHRPGLAFSDGLRRSPAYSGGKPLERNTPSLLHAAFQQGAFWDLRAGSLEDQASMVVHNPSEMGGSLEEASRRLSADPAYAEEFLRAFSGDPVIDRDEPATPLRIRRALSAYVRSLAPFNSPWDRHMRGEEEALDPEARLGFNLFMGKAKCATCHFPPLFNGTVPPLYLETDLEVLGVPAEPGPARAALDPDPGRMAFDGVPLSRGAFKTPTVRNVAFTAPYMHNGVFATLEEVVDFYDRGGGAGLGLLVPNQTLPPDSLGLSPSERKALVAFMRSLNDTAGTTAASASLPSRYTAAGPP